MIQYYYYPYSYNQDIGIVPKEWLPREFPVVDPSKFLQSAEAFQALMREASKFINHIAVSRDYAYHLMDAAQRNDRHTVHRLIDSLNMQVKYETSFTPGGLTIKFINIDPHTDCCRLEMFLQW